MYKKLALIGAAIAMVVAPVVTATSAQAADDLAISKTLVVNELVTRGPNGVHDEMIELRNISLLPQSITGLKVEIYNEVGVKIRTLTVNAAVSLQPGEFYTLASSTFSGVLPGRVQRYQPFMDESVPDLGGVQLVRNYNGVNVRLDGVATVDGIPAVEGQPATPLFVNAPLSIARSAVSTDTDDNANDFSIQQWTPGEPNFY